MSKDNYSLPARLFHYVTLQFTSVQELSFSLDRMLFKARADDAAHGRHVYVSGLARAGTTALMRFLYETGSFCSLTYRDMPLPLAQYLWKSMLSHSSKESQKIERAHKDGILIDFDSPESIEEIFWRVFCGKQYILPDRLVPMSVDDEVIEKYRQYISTILQIKSMDRYLAKNNNNILRIKSIREALPHACILIPFRDPIQQSLSLHNQHINFVNQHKKNGFTQKYMTWMAHHEFGFDHRRFDVDDSVSEFTPTSTSYWLDQWISVYSYLFQLCREMKNVYFINFEMLSENSDAILSALAEHINLPHTHSTFSLKKANQRIGPNISASHMERAYDQYNRLYQLSLEQLGL